MSMTFVFVIIGLMVAVLFLFVLLFNRWARKQPRHPANRTSTHDDGIPLYMMAGSTVIGAEGASAHESNNFAGGGGSFGGGGADASWSDSGGGGGDSGGGGDGGGGD
jgi:uncharacterized membrane protein YgcG